MTCSPTASARPLAGGSFCRIRVQEKRWPEASAHLILASPVVAVLFHYVLKDTPADRLSVLATLGIGTSVLGQLGDLVLSSIKRDVGIKDLGTVIPGHGGFLDRFDSLILVPPAIYHFLSLQLGPLAGGEPARILSGG